MFATIALLLLAWQEPEVPVSGHEGGVVDEEHRCRSARDTMRRRSSEEAQPSWKKTRVLEERLEFTADWQSRSWSMTDLYRSYRIRR